ncbi:aldehyde dehydrogenase (NADP(+)) [Altererythrobacter sp.]|uniref:aldehyde dehydrogenase (NADP(+)) n=1 Tax=Altererythrobacter sp. TaxID=1872480 RepID=UPI003D0CAA4B
MTFDGSIIVGADCIKTEATFAAFDPAANAELPIRFSEANTEHVAQACALAAEASEPFASLQPSARADFLESVAAAIESIGDLLIETAMSESGLPQARLMGERGRTCGQLRLFASEVRAGYWLDVTIDEALPDREPLPRPDVRRANKALGPVAVFGASNFPLAFSVAGGDTASALAAGCPVVVKGHPAHPGTGELVARAIQSAVESSGLPEGVFSYLPGTTKELGGALVADPRIKAVGFTGSRAGGLALAEIAANREEPIPVYAEMSAINPVVLLPGALADRGAGIGKDFIGSLTMGAGQFCTNPGLVVAIEGEGLDEFLAAASDAIAESAAQVMLTPGICAAYGAGVGALQGNASVREVGRGSSGGDNSCQAALFEVDAEAFLADASLGAEVFGSSSLVVRCASAGAMRRVIQSLEGQLTGTIHMTDEDSELAASVAEALSARVGRVLVNGWPTGVEVCHAMVHGGPFPATSDSRTTSVGTLAMMRFVRPVCYQNMPDRLRPAALQDANPWGLPRRVNGDWKS